MDFIFSIFGRACACGVDVLMCHTMLGLHRIEMYWMHVECCVAFLSVSQHGDECSHWQQNQSSLGGAVSCWARLPLSVPLAPLACSYPQETENLHNKHQVYFVQVVTLLCLCLHLNKFPSNGKSLSALGNHWHTYDTSQFIFHDLQHVFTLLFSLPRNGKKRNTKGLYRNGNENLIL